MSFSGITRSAVILAIAEFDELGRDEFLQLHGFGRARTYFLFHEGKHYDSKAIMGVAHGYQFPDQGILSADVFSGGELTVKAHLEKLGFEVHTRTNITARPLILLEPYDREEVQGIFAPNTLFVRQAGTWGLHGIVSIPDRPGDFAFFVTYGQTQGEHVFDEGITEEGVLTWQSQPRQGFADSRVQELINHDELRNSIYLFLRTRNREKYTYLGRLRYLSHDHEREYPVYFHWQLLDFPIPDYVLAEMQLALQPSAGVTASNGIRDGLLETPRPPSSERRPTTTRAFQTRKVADYTIQEARNRDLGLRGEQSVVDHETKYLVAHGREDLAKQIKHVSQIEGDGAGYDVLSFTLDGNNKYIEVKTTVGAAETAFFVTANEVEFSRQHPANYYLYRLYNFDQEANSGSYYVVNGSITDQFELVATAYRATQHIGEP